MNLWAAYHEWGKEFTSPHPFLRIYRQLWLVEEGGAFSSSGVATGKMPVSYKQALTHISNSNVTHWVIKKKKKSKSFRGTAWEEEKD